MKAKYIDVEFYKLQMVTCEDDDKIQLIKNFMKDNITDILANFLTTTEKSKHYLNLVYLTADD